MHTTNSILYCKGKYSNFKVMKLKPSTFFFLIKNTLETWGTTLVWSRSARACGNGCARPLPTNLDVAKPWQEQWSGIMRAFAFTVGQRSISDRLQFLTFPLMKWESCEPWCLACRDDSSVSHSHWFGGFPFNKCNISSSLLSATIIPFG